MRSTLLAGLLALTLSALHAEAAPSLEQKPLGAKESSLPGAFQDKAMKKRPLKGRFLHITDIHPDPHYQFKATVASGCHQREKKKKGKKGKGKELEEQEDQDYDVSIVDKEDLAGKYGTANSDCDCPLSLVNVTFDWLKKEWADEIDFVVWTGDNARHDIDRNRPRTPNEIFKLNHMIVDKMLDTFGKDMPIVPSIGNNDIYPHNVLSAGPSRITSEFLSIWKRFIPPEASHVFERGAYFSSEVIPDKLAVISLNTLFWYDSNTLVDGCGDHSNDPGALEMDWLEVQLSNFRQRGMQVWMTGHVPPHMGHYYDNCYLRYGDLALRYQDTIVGHLFGHMNIDHFFFIDVDELEATSNLLPLSPSNASIQSYGPYLPNSYSPSGRYTIQGRSGAKSLEQELKKDFGEMPGPRVLKLKDYAVMNVAPSVIPTYYPGIRVFSYNITGAEDDFRGLYEPTDKQEEDEEEQDEEEGEDTTDTLFSDSREEEDSSLLSTLKRKGGHRHKKPKDDCSLPENEDKPHCTFKHKPRHYSKHSPSRKNGPLSPLGFVQFYLPDLSKKSVKKGKKEPEWKVEYTTYKVKDLVPKGNLTQPAPVPFHLLPSYDPAVFQRPKNKAEHKEIAKKKDKFNKALKKVTPYRMKDLTVGSWIKLARMLVLEKKRWSKFAELMLVSTEADD
ncbi:hypothetical protein B9479_006949 [Cryptococcus floricola]|uniref:Endopolyphosphatase n=1 Tax=Cryptococcus floricola TaxID=2591691 RepID=A0A5D3AQA4_9TREE|nr:hypothetical protein B9479_006949 [Cryptococcus floricola]